MSTPKTPRLYDDPLELLTELERVARVGAWVWDFTRGGSFTEGARALLEIPEGQDHVEVFYERVHPDDRERVRAIQAKVPTGEAAPAVEFRVVLPSGQTRWLRGHITVLRDDAGKPYASFGALVDITDEKRTRDSLDQMLWALEEAHRVARVGTYTYNVDTQQLDWSQATRRMMGVPDGAPVTPDLGRKMTHPADWPAVDAWSARVLAGETVGPLRTRVTLPSGEERLMENSSAVRTNPRDGSRVLVGSTRDVTEQVLLEEQLRHSSTLEAVGTLAAGVAHDVNNALTVISGGLALLERRVSADDMPVLSDARRAVDQCATLTQQLLAFARRQPSLPRVVDVNAVLRDMVQLLRRVIRPDIALECEAMDAPVHVSIDPAQLESALMNLAVNARDAMPKGGTLTFRVERLAPGAPRPREAPAGAVCALHVEDTGVGIAPEHHRDIFRPYFTTKSESKGTGLGLASVLGVMEQNGGAATVRSAPGQGACFSLWLPLSTSAPVADTPVPAPAPPSAARVVLLVDDMELVRRTTARILESGGYRVVAAASGAEALELAAREPVDLVLTDLLMPQMDGRELARQLRAAGYEQPVVFVTGYVDDDEETESLTALGEVLLKPFAADRLFSVLERLLAKASAQR